MNNNKYILALALGIVTTITASIPREDVTTETSPLIEATQTSENTDSINAQETLAAIITIEKTDIQELTNDEEASLSDVQVEVEATLAATPDDSLAAKITTSEESYVATEISIEQAQALLGNDITTLTEGFEFEHDGKKYIIKTIVAPTVHTENTFVEESQK